MGHAFDMINRIKMNKEIKGKKKSFPTSTSYKPKGEFQFKEPTEEDLKRLALSNSNFLKQRKKYNTLAIIVSFVIAFSIMSWIFMEWPWRDMVTGFMKGYGR